MTLRHAGHAADEDDFLDVACRDAGIGEGLLTGFDRSLNQVVDQLFKFRAGQFHDQVFRPIGVCGDEGQIDLGFLRRREFDLGAFGGFFQALEGHSILAKIDALILLELIHQPIHDSLVEVVAAKIGISVGRLDFEDAVADLKDGHVERAAAQIIDGNPLVLLFVQAVREGRGGRLVDDPEDVQACDLARILGGLALAVVEVGRDGDDGFRDFLAEIILRRLPHLLQNHGGDFRWAVALAAQFDVRIAVVPLGHLIGQPFGGVCHLLAAELAAHEALHGKNRILRIGDRLAFCNLSDEALALLCDGDDGRCRTGSFCIGDHNRFAAAHNRNAGVRGSKVDADHFAHVPTPSSLGLSLKLLR